MKKRLFALFLAALMVVSLLPTVALADSHDLSVKRGSADATLGEDYEWDAAKTGRLVIKKSGLTVTGTTTTEYIAVNSGVTDLTIKDLSIHHPSSAPLRPITFSSGGKLILEGANSLTTQVVGMHGVVYLNGDGEIAGTGSLAADSVYIGFYCSGSLTISASGSVTVRGENIGICATGSITFADTVTKVLAYGNDSAGALQNGTTQWTFAENLSLKGSTTFDAPEASITDEAYYITASGDGIFPYIKAGSGEAKSVLIQAMPPHTHNGITFQPWTSENSLPTTEGSYYLTKDVTLTAAWTVPAGETNLCLNGYVLTWKAGAFTSIRVPSGTKLNLYDCGNTPHTFKVESMISSLTIPIIRSPMWQTIHGLS